MEIELPDGTVLDAPDGADIRKVVAGYRTRLKDPTSPEFKENVAKRVAANPSEYDPNSPEFQAKYGPTAQGTRKVNIRGVGIREQPVEDTFREGIGQGLTQAGRGATSLGIDVANAVLPNRDKSITSLVTGAKEDLGRIQKPEFATDEAIHNAEEIDRPLLDTTSGSVGSLVGNVAATAPISTLTKGLQVARNAPRLVQTLARWASSRPSRAALEGALNAEIMGDSENRGTSALYGGGLGLTLDRLGKLGSRTIRGLVQKSEATQDLEHLAGQQGKDIFVPVGQAADEAGDLTTRGARYLYREALPYAPLVTGKIRKQEQKAMETVRELAAEEANVSGAPLAEGAGKDLLQTRRDLKRAFDREYADTVKSYAFNVPQDFRDQVVARIKKEMPNIDETTVNKIADDVTEKMNRFSNGQSTIHGENILHAKTASRNLYRGYNEGVERKALEHGAGVYDDIIAKELSQGSVPENLADLKRFQELAEPYSSFTQFSKAVNAAKPQRGAFTPAQLARASKDPGTMLHLATTAQDVVGKSAASPSPAGRALVYGLGGFGLASNAPLVLGLAGAANVLGTKRAQKFLLGDLKMQRRLAEMLRKNPAAAQKVGALLRAGATQQVGESNASP